MSLWNVAIKRFQVLMSKKCSQLIEVEMTVHALQTFKAFIGFLFSHLHLTNIHAMVITESGVLETVLVDIVCQDIPGWASMGQMWLCMIIKLELAWVVGISAKFSVHVSFSIVIEDRTVSKEFHD